ncbi:hypothetical protein RM51_15795 [Chryseobacterium taiwanense]|uniref:Uncharacterized protein n=1 Tax=Chryseobacterium taiwanense TaxID=363331 RepID=A0A0B4E5E4_9FLAO|nr:hypothetical protein RM51_15795 [Chryseobacterium taiwanense]
MTTTKFELYSLKKDNLTISITVSITDHIVIYGYENGEIVKNITGDFDYEYYLIINKRNTKWLKIIRRLKSSDEVKELFIKLFSHEDCIEQIKKFCSRNFIKYEFNVWK